MISALVLTAGLGTRLGALTATIAKPALPVGDQSIAERVLRWLHREGVTDAVLNLHYLPETITNVIGDGRHLGISVRYSLEPSLLGSAGGPRHALPLINSDPFLIVNGDTLTDVALGPAIAAHRASKSDVTMVVIRNPAPDRYNSVCAGPDRVVTGIKTRTPQIAGGLVDPAAHGLWHFVGIQVVNKSVFASLPDNTPLETVGGVYKKMIETGAGLIKVFPVDATFYDIGTPEDYEATCRAIAPRAR